MPYKTFSEFAPAVSGNIESSEIAKVHNNPLVAASNQISWPTKYDAFVEKNNSQLQTFMVTDEIHEVSDIDIANGNGLYLYHRILPTDDPGSTNVSVSAGTIVTGLIDFNAGRIYFSNNPTGQFTVSYLAQPDPVHSSHVNALQNALMRMQNVLGAGSDQDQGIKNAQYLLYGTSPTGSLLAHIPNAVSIADFTKTTFTVAGESGFTHTINIGNSWDTVTVDTSQFIVQSSGGRQATTGSYPVPNSANVQFIINADSHLKAQTTIGATWPASGVGTWGTSGQYTGAGLRILGDVFIAGNLTTLGTETTLNGIRSVTGDMVTGSLTVSGDAIIRGNLQVDGDLTVGGGLGLETLTVSGELFVGDRISFTNRNGVVTTVDGLDPSYLTDRLVFMNRDPNVNCVLQCDWDPISYTEFYDPAASTNFTGSRTHTWTGTITNKVSDASGDWIHSSMRTPYFPLGIYEQSAWDGELLVRWTTGPLINRESTVLKLVSLDDPTYSTGCKFRVTDGSHYTNVQVGNQFSFYLPGNRYCIPNFIDPPTKPVSDPVVTISASNAKPLVLNIDGQIRRVAQANINVNMTAVTSNTSSMPATGTVIIYIYARSVGDVFMAESLGPPAFYARPFYVNIPDEIVIGEISLTRSASNWGNAGDWTVTHYAVDGYYDSGWLMTYIGMSAGRPNTHGAAYQSSVSNWGNGHMGNGFQAFHLESNKTNSKHIILNHNIGDERKLKHIELEVLVASTYWYGTADTVTDYKNDLTSNTLKKTVYKIKDPQMFNVDRKQMYVSFDVPNQLETLWDNASWSEFVKPNASNDIRGYVRFIIRPVRQGGIR